MPAKKTEMKTKVDPVTGANNVVLSADQQALMDEMSETGAIPEGYNFTPHNAHQPFTKSGEAVEEAPDVTPPA